MMNNDHVCMDLQQLRYVVEVAAERSFTRAAERCFVTQSALSHQIAALERELGHRLFIRSSRSVRLSEAGEAFLEHARAAVTSADRAREVVAQTAGELTGTLRLGVIPTVTAVRVPELLAVYRRAHPQVRIELLMGNSDHLVDEVRRGALDLAFLGVRPGDEPRGVALEHLAVDRHVVAVSRHHPLAHRRRVGLADLVGETFADFPAGSSGRAQSDAAFADAGVARDVAFEVGTADLLLGLVAHGLAVALVDPVTAEQHAPDVAAVPLSDGPHRIQYAVWDAQAPRRVTAAFLSVWERASAPARGRGGPGEDSGPAPVSES